LGHIISHKGIAMDPKKIKYIEGWESLNNFSKLRSIMGPVGYYRRFIEGFSRIANQISSLQKKGVKFEWNFECEERY
jgi:hypothetical protein